MFKKQVKDERIVGEQRRLNSEGFSLLYLGLLVDIFYRSVIARQNITDFWDIALLFWGVTGYVAIRTIGKGIAYYGGKNSILRKIIPPAAAASLVGSLTFKCLDPSITVGQLVYDALIFFIGFSMVTYLIYWISDKKANHIEDDSNLLEK